MKKISRTLFLQALIIFNILNAQAQANKAFIHSSLKNKWATEKQLLTSESVLYVENLDLVFVSNINGKPNEKDGNGFISKVAKDGSIIQLKWINGLNAPKGMGVFEGKLYVTDIDELVEIDIESAKIIKKYPAKKAKFLNDIAVDKNGNVYISDTYHNLLYRFNGGTLEIWLNVGNLFNPNGLLIDNNDLLVGCNNYIISVNLETKLVRTFITETGSVDGFIKLNDNQYLISDWTGNLFLCSRSAPKILLLSTEANNINAADFEYIKEMKLLLIPTFSDNRVMAYELNL